jgi:AraC-like DNA-binding protein
MKLSTLLTHLEARTGTLINVELLHPALYASDELKLAPEQQIHRAPFCEFAKRHSRPLKENCFRRKDETRRAAGKGKAYCDTCPFGIKEWIHPVMVEGRLAATIYIGHFSSPVFQTRIGKGRYRGPRPPPLPKDLSSIQQAAAFLEETIRTEVELWTASGQGQGKQNPGSFYRDVCLRYIEGNYREDIQLGHLAETLRMSPNYVSAKIRRECGKTFRQLLTEKRIAVACSLLEFEPDIPITEVGFQVGFNDSNYFSTVFRKHLGMSPKHYRSTR